VPRVESGPKLDYASRMLRALFAIVLFASANAAVAEKIYRWVDADGGTYYSDRPQLGAQQIDAPPKRDAPAPIADSGDSPLLGPYRGFEIVSPEPDQTVRVDDAKVPVGLILDPPLIAGHRLEFLVDGAAISVDKASTQLTLAGLAYGTHRAQSQIRNAANAVVARTAPVTFHLRKPTPPGVLE
jgi:hypothetical protein